MDNAICFPNAYLLDRDLSSGYLHPTFELLGPVRCGPDPEYRSCVVVNKDTNLRLAVTKCNSREFTSFHCACSCTGAEWGETLNPLSPKILIQFLETDLHTFRYRIS